MNGQEYLNKDLLYRSPMRFYDKDRKERRFSDYNNRHKGSRYFQVTYKIHRLIETSVGRNFDEVWNKAQSYIPAKWDKTLFQKDHYYICMPQWDRYENDYIYRPDGYYSRYFTVDQMRRLKVNSNWRRYYLDHTDGTIQARPTDKSNKYVNYNSHWYKRDYSEKVAALKKIEREKAPKEYIIDDGEKSRYEWKWLSTSRHTWSKGRTKMYTKHRKKGGIHLMKDEKAESHYITYLAKVKKK